MNKLLTGVVVLPIRVYQRFISPVLPPACRFYPTCSAYAAEAVLRHGVLRGGLLALRRLARCHPFGDFGYDPVPSAQDSRAVGHLSEE
ncbi:membrane protein insertion efficiency factor YidD [Candidatus Desulfovibrio trichonymphae]|uniref:Putative membrane protein insertion efficiency factor n=1 Tax=Candidatus Desulfovibrio trichonymphae TaxID=1725232 RepID=A0A1J1DPC1_9BACT|nr:membrane protein insertion efficiency factor YidD [Candidatus Desulfovibrio trichonymphae]BAV91689.1 membrane protein insertion efficiency factor YidD [Candidatus Desulfovibrio trichonymphae]GHU91199.1 putative membrane protein insertion efficiency factor [Deltaproteobacteria bacterium]GHU94832.1 putative membrane protein insertion efficiency factor [Deltaproteobacteria bacterium]GHV00019.1 putative membrane protein insertion efficiency factor [Deltaproteobacteria bacterium]